MSTRPTAGQLLRYVGGKAEGWTRKDPKDSIAPAGARLRPRDIGDGSSRTAWSTASTSRMAGSSPSRRSTASTRANIVSPTDRPTGPTCAVDVRDRWRRGPAGHAGLDVRATASTRRSWSRCPTSRPSASPEPVRRPEPIGGPDQGDTEADQEALTGRAHDPPAGRQSDAADAAGHARARHRLLRRCSPGSSACWPAAATPPSTRSSPSGGSCPADLTAAWARGDYLSQPDRDPGDQPVPARRLGPPAVQHALPVDLRQQRRGPLRPARVPRLLPARRRPGRPHRRSPSTRPRRSRRSAHPARSRRPWAPTSCSSRGPG